MKTTTIPKRYRLQSLPDHFNTGRLKDGTQVFMSTNYSKLVAVFFDPEGNYLKILIRELSQQAQSDLLAKILDHQEEWAEYHVCWEDLDRWAEELGFVEGVISMKKFSLPEYELGIQDLPDTYQEFVDSGSDIPEDFQEDIREWKEVNDYVFVWGQDYDVDQEGVVVST